MSQLNSEIIINLSGNLTSKARAYSSEMKKFAESNSRMAKGFRHAVRGVNKGLDAMENRYTALVATVAGGAVANRLVTLDRRLSRLSVAADLTKEQTRALYEEIENISRSEGIRIDPTQTLEGLEVVMEKLGDIEFARRNMENIALFSQATGATGGHIGAVLTQLKKLSVETQQEVLTAMDSLNVQGKSGAFTMASFAAQGERLLSTYAATGRQGVEAVLELGAAMQVIRSGAGSDEQAVTAYEALIREMTTPDKVKKLKELAGIHVFDPEKLKDGVEVMRPLPDLMREIITEAGSSTRYTMTQALDTIKFGEEAIRALKPLMGEFSAKGSITSFDAFLSVTADGSTTLKDAAKVAKDYQASVDNLMTALHRLTQRELAEPFQDLADAVNSLDAATLDRWLQLGKNIGLTVAGLVAARKALGVAKDLKAVFGKKGGVGDAANTLAGGVTPVYVVNMPAANALQQGQAGTQGKYSGASGRHRWLNIAAQGTGVGYGLMNLAPEFSPINIRRASEVDTTGLPDSFVPGAGLLDVFDEISGWFRGSSATPPVNEVGEIRGKIAIEMHENRTRIKTAEVRYNGIPLTVDHGLSMAD
ncbi:hypothetical protein [Grimontia hollisae]|uniref:Phage-related minor tail protein n=1 Tax=Grimontia hollisae TaxID=673 RepID=A0A377HN18_GRIHO|nr:hypothetical protein [Grimontia hollisae]STO57628.1 Phage-related minor tail protein [Grimontia hollisae]